MTGSTDTTPTMCLLHGDFHVMSTDCWRVTLDWYLAHPDLDDTARRNAYQAAVEAQMLNNLQETPVDPTICPTPDCTSPKAPRQYLCRGCWFTLQPAARRALNRHDATALRRLSELREQLRDGVPVRQVVITP